MTGYSKGARGERELINLFAQHGYSVIRAAGSGVSQTSPPDILLFKHGRQYALECKAWDKGRIAIPHDKFAALQAWQDNTGITTMLAWKIPYKGWLFIHLDELEKNPQSYSITRKKAEVIGRTPEAILQ